MPAPALDNPRDDSRHAQKYSQFPRPLMRICLIHGKLGPALRHLGHEVLEILPPPGVTDVRTILAPHDFAPDFLLQTEVLGPRVILAGLETLECRKVFLSVDTHLNAFWHARYGALFDAVATTQPSWAPKLRALGLRQVFELPWFGSLAPFKAFAARGHDVAFCGRIGPERPIRRRFADFLQRGFAAAIETDLPYDAMLGLFGDTRIVPNESIAGEINFRLFEAASLGCLVIAQAGPDLGTLFEIGREILVYSNALELADRLRHCLTRPAEAERMGRAARARVLAHHLPLHRAQTLLAHFPLIEPSVAATGSDAALTFHLTLLDLMETGRGPSPS